MIFHHKSHFIKPIYIGYQHTRIHPIISQLPCSAEIFKLKVWLTHLHLKGLFLSNGSRHYKPRFYPKKFFLVMKLPHKNYFSASNLRGRPLIESCLYWHINCGFGPKIANYGHFGPFCANFGVKIGPYGHGSKIRIGH